MDIYEEELLFTFVMYYTEYFYTNHNIQMSIGLKMFNNDNIRLIKFFLDFFF